MKPKHLSLLSVGMILIVFASIYFSPGMWETKTPESNIAPSESSEIYISQTQMKENYGWLDIVLWTESKENFEKAFGVALNKTNYPLGFKKDPSCIDPVGGGDEWQYDKICYQYVLRPNTNNLLKDVSTISKGKTLVVIGTVYNDRQNFLGDAYWY
jgi:hypothetical protein